MESSLICNYKRCLTQLSSIAWVTCCSHIFCNEHSPFCEDDKKCPLCSTDLSGKYDIIERHLNPTEEFKTFVLAGMNPLTILDIGASAIQFWNFQTYQEKLYLSSTVKRMRGRLAQAESSHESEVERLKNTIQQEAQKCENLKKELSNYIKKTQSLEERLERSEMKNKQLYDTAIQKKQYGQRREQYSGELFKQKPQPPEEYMRQSQHIPQTPRSVFNFEPMSSQQYGRNFGTYRK